MTAEAFLRRVFLAIEVDDDFTGAVLRLGDNSRLLFRHRVGERWARAVNEQGEDTTTTQASHVLASIRLFRLNAKHLDITFLDGGRWEAQFAH